MCKKCVHYTGDLTTKTCFRMALLGLLFIFFMIYVGMEVAFGLYIFTFATKSSSKFSKTQGTTLNTVFWGFFAFGRFVSIFVTKVLSPNGMYFNIVCMRTSEYSTTLNHILGLLRCDLIGTIISTVILLCYPLYANSAEFFLWLGVAIYGFSIASTFPTGISWAEQYITINGRYLYLAQKFFCAVD